MVRKLFCEISPLTYAISLWKENIIHDVNDLFHPIRYAETRQKEPLPYVIKSHSSTIVRKLEGVDATLKINKRTNLKLASSTINGLIIHPGETFSFWHQIGKPAAEKDIWKV